jgi:hypothetical protein
MYKACIIEPFEFINFHICSSLLQQGFETSGIHIRLDDEHLFFEEKSLEVGRNSNLDEMNLAEYRGQGEENQSETVFLSLYDMFISGGEYLLKEKATTDAILKLLKNNQLLVVLLPIQMLEKKEHTHQSITTLQEFLTIIKTSGIKTQTYYLPTVYGPWQSTYFSFQATIMNEGKSNDSLRETREWKFDALFIDDIIEVLMDRVESCIEGSFLLQSEIPNQWEHCAKALKMNIDDFHKPREKNLLIEEGITKVVVKSNTTPEVGLRSQKEHIERLIKGRI